jgi:hypothetical protein
MLQYKIGSIDPASAAANKGAPKKPPVSAAPAVPAGQRCGGAASIATYALPLGLLARLVRRCKVLQSFVKR